MRAAFRGRVTLISFLPSAIFVKRRPKPMFFSTLMCGVDAHKTGKTMAISRWAGGRSFTTPAADIDGARN